MQVPCQKNLTVPLPTISRREAPRKFLFKDGIKIFRWYHYLVHLVESWSTFLWKILKNEAFKLAITCLEGHDFLLFLMVVSRFCNFEPQRSLFSIGSPAFDTGSASLGTSSTYVPAATPQDRNLLSVDSLTDSHIKLRKFVSQLDWKKIAEPCLTLSLDVTMAAVALESLSDMVHRLTLFKTLKNKEKSQKIYPVLLTTLYT